MKRLAWHRRKEMRTLHAQGRGVTFSRDKDHVFHKEYVDEIPYAWEDFKDPGSLRDWMSISEGLGYPPVYAVADDEESYNTDSEDPSYSDDSEMSDDSGHWPPQHYDVVASDGRGNLVGSFYGPTSCNGFDVSREFYKQQRRRHNAQKCPRPPPPTTNELYREEMLGLISRFW
jgi:hypothetical protein